MATRAAESAAPAADGDRTGTFDALRVRDFRFLWLNSLSFSIGRGMQLVAVSWLVLELTDSAALVGTVLFAQGAPMALLVLPAGVWADRADRKALLLASQLISLAATALLTGLIIWDVVSTWQIVVLSVVMGSAMALGQPSRQALVPALVGPDRLMNAVVLNNIVQNVAFIIGPAIAGALLAVSGFEGAFLVQVAILAAGLPWLAAIRSSSARPDRAARESGRKELLEGLRHIAASPFIRSLFVVTAFTGAFFVGTYQALVPVFARDVLDAGETGLGLLSAAFGTGMFTGSMLIASRGSMGRKGEVLLASLLLGSVVFLIFAVSDWYGLSLVMMLLWGFGAAFFMNLTITLIQSHTPDELMGRVMSVQALAFYGMAPIGNLFAGGVAEVTSPQAAAAVGALAVGVMAVFFLLREPALRSAT
jgi:MFS family permease